MNLFFLLPKKIQQPPLHLSDEELKTTMAQEKSKALSSSLLTVFMQNLLADYKQLINLTLPANITHPVRANHCFARIVLDWLFADCWYKHLHKKAPACTQLTQAQLGAAVDRMNQWLQNPQLLVQDNDASLRYRRLNKKPSSR